MSTTTPFTRLALIALLSLVLSACAQTRSNYNGSQIWREQECRTLVDEAQRNDCLRQAGISFEEYRDDAGR